MRRNAKRRLSPLDYRTGRKTAPVKDKAEIGAVASLTELSLLPKRTPKRTKPASAQKGKKNLQKK